MTLHGSVAGAVLLRNQRADTPRPRERWGAAVRQPWRRNGGGFISRSWNSKRPLVVTDVVLTKTLGFRRAREIRARITRQMDLWERGQHAEVVGDAKAEGAAVEGRAASCGKE